MKIIDGWIDEAIGIYYPHKSMPRSGYKATHLVLHGTAGGTSAEAIAKYFRDSEVQASTHIIIGTDGKFAQGINLNDAAWGNGALVNPRYPFPNLVNPNYYTASIEHCKPSTDNSDQLTPAQKETSFRVVKAVCEYLGIDQRAGDEHGGIISHADLDSVNRARCPGPYPWQELFDFLGNPQQETTMLTIDQASKYFDEVEKDQRWRCKQTGKDIAYANLQHYRTRPGPLAGISQYGLPTSNEISLGYKNATVQRCERGSMMYDPDHHFDRVPGYPDSEPCYPGHIEAFYDAAARVDQLNQQVTDLQQQLAEAKASGDIEALKKQLDETQTRLSLAAAAHKQIVVVEQRMAEGGVI